MAVSIAAIIPLYNGDRWIEEAVRSVFAQTVQPDEFLVVDDGSTDGGSGAAIVARLAKERSVTLLHKPNGGQSSARNHGVAHAKSSLIALLDQDDVWYPRHLEILRKPFYDPRPSPLGWVYSDVDLIDEAGRLTCRNHLRDHPKEHPKRHLARCLSEDIHVLPGASLICRRAFDAVGGFDERLCGYEDDDLFVRLFSAGYDNVFVPDALLQWRISPASCGHSHRMFKSGLIYMEKLVREYPDHRKAIVARFIKAFADRYRTSLKAGSVDECREIHAGLDRVTSLLRNPVRRAAVRFLLPIIGAGFAAKALLKMVRGIGAGGRVRAA